MNYQKFRLPTPNFWVKAALIVLLIERFCIWFFYSRVFVDSDQTVLWVAVKEYAQGIFHEPYYFGQDYNFMLEAILAVPLYWIGIGPELSLPVISNILFLVPFLFFAWFAHQREDYATSVLALVLPITVTVEFAINSGIPRGFVTGMPFLSMLVPVLFSPNSFRKLSWAILGAGLAYLFNANTVLFSLPVLVYLGLRNIRNPKFYWATVVLSTPILLLKYLADSYYTQHQYLITHSLSGLQPQLEFWVAGISNLDELLHNGMPLFWGNPWLVFVLIMLISIVFFIKNQSRKGIAGLVFLAFCLFIISVPKIHDASEILVLSTVRMWLAIPLVLLLFVYWLIKDNKTFQKSTPAILLVGIVFIGVKWIPIKERIANYSKDFVIHRPINVIELSELKRRCSEVYDLSQANNAELIVGCYEWHYTVPMLEFVSYGCPCLIDDFPPTLMAVHERRTWRIIEENSTRRTNIMCYGVDVSRYVQLPDSLRRLVQVSENPRMFNLKLNYEYPLQAIRELQFFNRHSDSLLLRMHHRED